MEKIIYKEPDGLVAIVAPASKIDLEKIFGTMSQQEYETHILENSIPVGGYDVHLALDSDIPSDSYFRDAWIQNKNKIEIDMAAARVLQLNRIRFARDSKWKDFDSRYTAAERDGLDLTKLQVERQTLKDIPQVAQPNIDAAMTPELLKDIWPAGL